MTKAERVYSTPPTSTFAVSENPHGARGAVELSSTQVIPASLAHASRSAIRTNETPLRRLLQSGLGHQL